MLIGYGVVVIRTVAAHSMLLLTIPIWALCMAARRLIQKIRWLCRPSLRRVADDGVSTTTAGGYRKRGIFLVVVTEDENLKYRGYVAIQ